MTSLISKKVICPNCGTEGSITLYSSINVTLNPELQKKMDNGELFIWKCPNCEKQYICIYPFIYHDMEKGILQCLSLNISEERLKEFGLSGIIKINW
jgi:predicted RNA-binding Zn-ribbon protein involved in translation (DUF1610 family)